MIWVLGIWKRHEIFECDLLEGNADFVLTNPPYIVRSESNLYLSFHYTIRTEDTSNMLQIEPQVIAGGGHGHL